MTKDERDEIDGWWIITSYDPPQGPYFSKKGEPIDDYKGMNIYAVDGSCRGDFHGWELREIEARESTKILAALDEKDAEIERLRKALERCARAAGGECSFGACEDVEAIVADTLEDYQ